jgi:hypothetical protein
MVYFLFIYFSGLVGYAEPCGFRRYAPRNDGLLLWFVYVYNLKSLNFKIFKLLNAGLLRRRAP